VLQVSRLLTTAQGLAVSLSLRQTHRTILIRHGEIHVSSHRTSWCCL
jgi:hypothetical protein